MMYYIEQYLKSYPQLINCKNDILKAYNNIKNTFESGNKLLICGNGGSASDSDHIAGELLKGFIHKRPLNKNHNNLDPIILKNLQGSLPAISLTGFNAFNTAYANDCNSDYTFAQLIWGLGKKNDILLAISTSGNSKNIINAIKVAKYKQMLTIGLTGENGGIMKNIVDTNISAPGKKVYEIQELHLPIYHLICLMLENYFFNNEN